MAKTYAAKDVSFVFAGVRYDDAVVGFDLGDEPDRSTALVMSRQPYGYRVEMTATLAPRGGVDFQMACFARAYHAPNVVSLMRELLRYERRREDAGKRGHVTYEEIAQCAEDTVRVQCLRVLATTLSETMRFA